MIQNHPKFYFGRLLWNERFSIAERRRSANDNLYGIRAHRSPGIRSRQGNYMGAFLKDFMHYKDCCQKLFKTSVKQYEKLRG